MESLEFAVEIAAPAARVMREFWELDDWPAVATHVQAIDMHYRDDEVQILTMQVASNGHAERFRSVRIRQPGAIFFFQPQPPPALTSHYGWWRISEGAAGTAVASQHCFEVEPVAAARLLAAAGRNGGHATADAGAPAAAADPASAGAAAPGRPAASISELRDGLRRILHHNSLQTMLALKRRLEAAAAGEER